MEVEIVIIFYRVGYNSKKGKIVLNIYYLQGIVYIF